MRGWRSSRDRSASEERLRVERLLDYASRKGGDLLAPPKPRSRLSAWSHLLWCRMQIEYDVSQALLRAAAYCQRKIAEIICAEFGL